MYTHAQLDSNGICNGFGMLKEIVDNSSVVYLPDGWDEDLLWRKFENDTWSVEKYEGFLDATDPLDLVKKRKMAELKNLEFDGLQTFQSSALGAPYTYLSAMDDMLLLNGEYSYVKSDDYDGLPILWYTVESGNVDHTKEQFVRVYLDGRENVKAVKFHRANLEAQVNAATTIADIDAIAW